MRFNIHFSLHGVSGLPLLELRLMGLERGFIEHELARPHVDVAKCEQHLEEMLFWLDEINVNLASRSSNPSVRFHFDETLKVGMGSRLLSPLRVRGHLAGRGITV